MKKIDIFNKRRRGFTDNNQGIAVMATLTALMPLLVIVGIIVVIWMLSQFIVPLIILIVVIIVLSVVVKWAFGIRAPKYLTKGVEEAVRYGERGITAGAGWFEKLIGR